MSSHSGFLAELRKYRKLAKQQGWDVPDCPSGGNHWIWVNPAIAPPGGRVVVGGAGSARGLLNTVAKLRQAGLVTDEPRAGRKPKVRD